MKGIRNPLLAVLLASCALALVPLAVSAADPVDPDGVELTRAATDLRDVILDHDPDTVNTIVTLADQTHRPTKAVCLARDHQGQPLGRGWVKVPPKGLRLVVASDLSNGADFVGTIRCNAQGHVAGAAFILGLGFSDTEVDNAHHFGWSVIQVQAAVSY